MLNALSVQYAFQGHADHGPRSVHPARPGLAPVTGGNPPVSPAFRTWQGALAGLVLGLTAVWLAAPYLAGGQIVPFDAIDYYFPAFHALAQARAQGESGLLNPYLLSGHAAVADPLSWVFAPTYRLLAECLPHPSPAWLAGWQVAHLLLGSAGVLLLLRRYGAGLGDAGAEPAGLDWAPATLGAVVYLLGGPASGRLQHVIMTLGYSWAPWALLCLLGIFAGRTARARWLAAAGFAVTAALLAVNRDQVAYLFCLLLLAVALWQALAAWRRGGAALTQRLGPLFVAGLACMALLALPVLLTLDMLATSNRPQVDFTLAAHGSLQPASLLTLLHPDIFAALQPGRYWGPGTLPWMALSKTGFDWTDDSVSQLYIGCLPVLLLVLLAARHLRGQAGRGLQLTAPCAAMLLFAALYMLGVYTPVFRLLYDLLPGVDLFRRPNDATFLWNFLLALLSGCALQGWLQAGRGPGAGAAAYLLLLSLASLIALWLGLRLDHLPQVGRALLAVWALHLAGLLLLGFLARRLPSAIAGWLLVALTAADLLAQNTQTPFNAMPADAVAPYAEPGRQLAGRIRAILAETPTPGRAEIFGLGGAWQNAPMVHGIEQTLGYSPLRQQAYDDLVGARQNSHEPVRRLTAAFTGYDSPLARRLGIAVVVTSEPMDTLLPKTSTAGLRLMEHLSGAYIYRTAAPAPRWMLQSARNLAALTAAAPDMAAGLEPDPALGSVELVSRSATRLVLRVRMLSAGGLVLHEIRHPAWQAFRNGQPQRIRTAGLLFQAVDLPLGDSEVEFRFAPLSAEAAGGLLNRLRLSAH